ncbi:hypothetical protein HGQ17_13580 [Nesterenkonia sp. MY13]|uniref:Putative Flp pilus-assembly TadG-like N-terminal domain-containing protein n=1 Tax=Nesterenkonia sedimenti TaxID=1463632 RepID=A0A7X8TLK2_9MICC|nr:Rv3654c family TadE-like protein [Nesterenkonia sedimenti]NLS11007.1 hypothetical protein [Nesterenkonia sedimenti]
MIRGAHTEDRGSGTVVAVGIIAVLILLLALVAVLGAVAVATTHATRAADLAALAGADTARGLNTGDPCTVAGQVAARNGVELESCSVGGEYPTEVRVTVSKRFDVVVLSELLPAELSTQQTSRAGPPEALHGS